MKIPSLFRTGQILANNIAKIVVVLAISVPFGIAFVATSTRANKPSEQHIRLPSLKEPIQGYTKPVEASESELRALKRDSGLMLLSLGLILGGIKIYRSEKDG